MTSELPSNILGYLKNTTVKKDNAKKFIQLIDGTKFGEYITVPSGVGELKIIRYKNEIIRAVIRLNRDALHRSTIAKIETAGQWPTGTNGHLTTSQKTSGVKFSRKPTDSEKQDIRELMKAKSSKLSIDVDHSLPDESTGSPERRYIVVHDRRYSRINGSRTAITEEGTIGNNGGFSILATKCEKRAGFCVADIMGGFLGCTPGLLTCSITGPVAPGCAVALLAICAPEAALVAVSGNCSYIVKNCEVDI
ncbi:hypothetical protein [Haloferax mucosum]|uniref:hypothetical protein n=1 Tax=Haloferax mucosum TaxID=403181 RepID=UPI00126782BB|nr:hypothetical protein [Haloferax mucosum]